MLFEGTINLINAIVGIHDRQIQTRPTRAKSLFNSAES